MGDEVGFIGKVSDDELGSKYEEGLRSEKVQYFYSKKKRRITNRHMFDISHTGLGKNNVHISWYSRKN